MASDSDKNQQQHDREQRERQQQEQRDTPPPGAGPAARTAQQDHTPRQEEQDRRERQRRAAPTAEQRANTEQMEAQQREAMAAASIGAQIILDYNSQAGLGARGGAAGTIEENTMLRDENLVALGLDPVAPSGPPLTGEALAAKRKREEEDAARAAEPKHVSGQATKHSSLAAGIQNVPEPAPPPARGA